MYEVIKSILDYLISNYALYAVVTMSAISVITIFVLALVKKPIKHLTAKITHEKVRKLVNKVFIFLAFGISAFGWAILNYFAPSYFPLDAFEIVLTGAFSIVLYALGDGVLTKSSAQQLVESIKDFAEDEKKDKNNSDKNAKDPIKEFWKTVK
jgi:hypothetical protein